MGSGMSGSGTAGHTMGSGPQNSVDGGRGMMHGDTVTHAMTPLMQQMNDVMKGVHDTMRGEVSHENMAKMSQVMSHMSKELSDMGRAMDRGKVSDRQMQTMQDRLAQMKTVLESIQQQK